MKANEEIWYYAAIIHHPDDWKWADWLHKSMETYVIPREFADQKINNRAIPKRLHPIFLARDAMPLHALTSSTPSEQRE